MKKCSVDIILKDTELPKNLLSKMKNRKEVSFYCIEMATRDIKVKSEDLQDDSSDVMAKYGKHNLSIMNLYSIIKKHQGIIDISSVESKGTKISIYLPKL